MVANFGLAADADDAAVREAVQTAILDEKLEPKKVKELTVTPNAQAREEFFSDLDKRMEDRFSKFEEKMLTTITKAQPAGGDGADASTGLGRKAYAMAGSALGEYNDEARVRVKSIVERFDDSRTGATWDMYRGRDQMFRKEFSGRPVMTGVGIDENCDIAPRRLDVPSDRQKAIAGAWFKLMVNKSCNAHRQAIPPAMRMTEEDWQLCQYAVHECKFVGPVGADDKGEEAQFWSKGNRIHNELHRKTLLDDTLSGGLEAVPIEFDDLVIFTPLLTGEIYPLVTVRNVTRRRIEGVSIGNPTLSWGVSEGTSIGLFDTDAFIAAFDTNIHPITGAIESGLDFEADSPVAIGDALVDRYGVRFQQELDNVVTSGNGTDRPEGLFVSSAVTTTTSENGAVGPPEIDDYEALLFGVKKEFRTEAGRARSVYITNETTYSRARGIPVGASDARRVFGMDHESYELLGHPHKINESIDNADAGFFCMNRYRMYRRSGFGIRVVTEDADLARRNTRMIILRARFGGQLELGGAGYRITDMQS
jgi:HK97 family phage major capsid protein